MPPRGRGGGFRGRGSRGRGGRGRGGKPGARWGPDRRFDGARLEDKDETSESEGGEAEESVDEMSEEEDEQEEEAAPVRPYMALLQGFNQEKESDASSRKNKRRKLDNGKSAAAQPASDSEADEQQPEDGKDVDQAEDDAEEPAEEDVALDDDSDDDDEADPFVTHFDHPDEQLSARRVQAVKKGEWATKRTLVAPWRVTQMQPGESVADDVPAPVSGLDGFRLKKKLRESAEGKMGGKKFGEIEKKLGPMLFGYRDMLYCDRTVKDSQALKQLTCLHALNHVFKTRDRVIKNNHRIAKEGDNAELGIQDQGFTRPKVLFLLPTRNSCARVVNVLRDLCEPDQQENRKRFDDSYVDKENKFGQDRPVDFRDLFEGNDDDMFRIGIKFTRKTMKYFSQFYSSDILLASPLGLRMAIGSEEDAGSKKKGKKGKKVDYDFLSSIEMVVVDQADALLMQNWEHVEFIFEHLNLRPVDYSDGCDWGRLRPWYSEEWARHFRQTVVLSAYNTPELAELFRVHCQNWEGKARLQLECLGKLQLQRGIGSGSGGIKVRQTFSRFQTPSPDRDPDTRFDYFVTTIIPSLLKRGKEAEGTLLFIPSYLDFVRVRNYLANSPDVMTLSFGAISEYTDVPEASRARSHFLNGRHRLLLYTERAHHFRRYQLRGVKRVIFYGLPDNPLFYTEIAGGYLARSEEDMRIEPGKGVVRVMFSKYDVLKLERIAGSKRVGKMIQDRGDTFDFV